MTGERIRDGGAFESTAGYAMQQHHDRHPLRRVENSNQKKPGSLLKANEASSSIGHETSFGMEKVVGLTGVGASFGQRRRLPKLRMVSQLMLGVQQCCRSKRQTGSTIRYA